MITSPPIFILYFLGGLLNIRGSILFKNWVITNNIIYIACGCILYAIDTFIWAMILKQGAALSTGGAMWSACTLLISSAVGMLWYSERLTWAQGIGIGLVLIGLVLCE